MALTQYTADTDIIETLGTKPEDRPTLTDNTFKAKFDENAANIKAFLNAMIAELASTAAGKGASQIGIEDSAGRFTATQIEAALAEIAGSGRTTETVKGLADLISTKGTALQAAKAVYVATTGNDTTGDGTSGNPYATPTKALSMIPKNLNGFTATINIATGTYNDNLYITTYYGGVLNIVISGTVTINQAQVYYCSCNVQFNGTGTLVLGTASLAAIAIISSSIYFASGLTISVAGAAGQVGLTSDYSLVAIMGTVTLGTNSYGIASRASSNLYIATINGGTAAIGVGAQTGGRITYNAASYTATTMTQTVNGGRIYTGAQTSVPNY